LTDAHLQLGLLYEDMQDTPKAVAEYEIVIQQRASVSQAHYRLARLYQKTGQVELAAKEFATLKKLKQDRSIPAMKPLDKVADP
jgi:Tfp pilus assembly protein PilF